MLKRHDGSDASLNALKILVAVVVGLVIRMLVDGHSTPAIFPYSRVLRLEYENTRLRQLLGMPPVQQPEVMSILKPIPADRRRRTRG